MNNAVGAVTSIQKEINKDDLWNYFISMQWS